MKKIRNEAVTTTTIDETISMLRQYFNANALQNGVTQAMPGPDGALESLVQIQDLLFPCHCEELWGVYTNDREARVGHREEFMV